MRSPPHFRIASVTLALVACGLDVVGIDPAPLDVAPEGGTGAGPDAKGAETGSGPADVGAPDVVDAGFDAADGNPCNVADACAPLRVFITSQGSTAKIGGVSAADDKCQKLAKAAGLNGTWQAWLSTSPDTSPVNRFTTKNLGPYVRIDGKVVADSWNALVKDNLRAPIQIDETGGNQGNIEVWTGTNRSGNQAVTGCNGFNDDQASGTPATVGVADQVGPGWSSIYTQTCERNIQRLYCFEQ